ncbi:MAG: penicillin-binding transpeptidase domain-containing protein [Blastocatellia bacterium]
MKLMSSEKRLSKLFSLIAVSILVFSAGLQAQTKKSSTAKKPFVKKTAAQAKDARKESRKTSAKDKNRARNTKNSVSDKSKTTAKANSKAKPSAKDKNRLSESKSKKDPKKIAAERRAEAERRKKEEARRQAALAEQRRREQLAREARARKLAFERGLRTETSANIANDITDTEDPTVRQAAVEALGSRAGTVVVMEAKTGKIVSMVNQDWAIRESFKPCSTIKLVTGVAGLNENIINGDGNISGESSSMTLDNALAYSNNGYFQRVGVKIGSGKMISYAKNLGLGEKTGINADGETAGKLPFGNNNARIYSHGDDFEVTPLQLAVMVSALSNGGKKVVPQIPRSRYENARFRSNYRQPVTLPEKSVIGVLPGMMGAAEYGTARRGVNATMGVAGKTGSCIGKGSWVGLFASVAPVEDPEYAVVVITRGEGERGKYAAAVAGRVYQALQNRISRNPEKNLALKQLRAKPLTNLSVAAMEDEEEEDSDSADEVTETTRPVIVVGTQQRPAEQRKTVVKTTQSRPVFKPVVIPYKKDTDLNSTPSKDRPRVIKNK